MKIDILTILIPLLTSSIVGCIFIIISISRDKFLKTIDINQMFATIKILKFLLFIIISTSLIVLISLELVHFDNEQINKVLNNPNKRLAYLSVITIINITFSTFYISFLNLSNKDCYYIENYRNSGKRLYILQKYKDHYICTIDSPKNDSRIIKKIEDFNNIELKYYYNSNLEHFDISAVFEHKSHIKRVILYWFSQLILVVIALLIVFLLLFINYIFNFESKILLWITIILIIYIIYYFFKILKMNWSKLKKYLDRRKNNL